MRTIARALLVAAVAISAACTSSPEVEPQERSAEPTPDEVAEPDQPSKSAIRTAEIYSAVIRQLITKDHTFGGGKSPFKHIFILDGAVDDIGDPMDGNIFDVSPVPFPEDVATEIEASLEDLPPIEFVKDANKVRSGPDGMGGVQKQGVILGFGPIERHGKKVHVSNQLWCGGLCAQWLTYVLVRTDDGWKISGTTGPIAIS